MGYDTEDQVKQELGIGTWRELSKEKVLRLAAMMPEMDTDLALKISEQFPSFKEFADRVVDAMETTHASTLHANEHSDEHVHDAYAEIRAILKAELDKGDLEWEQRRWLIEQIQDTGRQQFLKDSENKRFLDSTLGRIVLGIGGVATLAVAVMGGVAIGGQVSDGDS